MRIAFAGASGTGKTELMRHVQEAYGLEACPIGSRSVSKEMGYSNPYDVDLDGRRMEFQERLFAAKRDWERARERFVTDRTCFDNLVYTILDGDAKRIGPRDLREYEVAFRRYTHVFFLPVSVFQRLGGDPHRVTNPAYHRTFDLLLLAKIREASMEALATSTPGPRVVVLLNSSVSERIREIDETLKPV